MGFWRQGARDGHLIKFVIEARTDTLDMAVCISFHEAEYPLRYPYGAIGRSEGE